MTKKVSKQESTSHIRDLVLLFAVPTLVILLAFGLIYVPRWFANPTYDFIYTSCSSYNCEDSYTVDRYGKISYVSSSDGTPSTLNYFDTSENKSHTISLSEARDYTLDKSSRSPDGYALAKDTQRSSGFLFWSNSGSGGWFLEDGAKKKQIQLGYGDDAYVDADLVGWVTDGK